MAKKRRAARRADPRAIARERLARETGAVIREPGGRLTVALAYPNSYEVGMSNLGFQKVYHLFNRRDDVACERVFFPSADEISFMEDNHRSLASLESGRPLMKFDVIAFSVTFELDYLNVLTMLDLAGVPFKGRTAADPLVVAGGFCVTLNPEVLAPFVDLALIGEGENIVDPLCAALNGGERDVRTMANLPGVYVPGAYRPRYAADGTIEKMIVSPGHPETVARVWAEEWATRPTHTYIHTPDTVFGDMGLVELGKGCGKHCRFCAAGYAYRPTRHANTETLLKRIDETLDTHGKVGLVGSAVADHPDVEKIFARIVDRSGAFSVSSLRLDKLTDSVLALLAKGGSHTVTVAPEAGTERLRRTINKDISDEVILDAAKRIARAGPFNLKLYFLVGLPGETGEDVEGIAALVRSIREAMVAGSKERGRMGDITASVNGFVPKPATPFQWEPFAGEKEVAAKLKRVAAGLAGVPNVTVQTGSARLDYVQTLLSVGDRRVADILESAWRAGGDWKKALRESDVDADFFVLRRKRVDETLPWSVIDHGLRAGYLAKELRLSTRGAVTPECPPPEETCERCGHFVGVCSHEESSRALRMRSWQALRDISSVE